MATHAASNPDRQERDGRVVKNVSTQNRSSFAASDNMPESRTVGATFTRSQSITAKAANNNASDVTVHKGKQISKKEAKRKRKKRSIVRKARGAVRVARQTAAVAMFWVLLSIAVYISFWIFVLGFFSMLGFLAEYSSDIASGLVEAGVTEYTGVKFLGQFASAVGLGKLLPGETIGLVFWALASLCAALGYMIIGFWYVIAGVRIFSSTSMAIVTALMMILDFIPLLNIFPWMVIWVVFITMAIVASIGKTVVKGAVAPMRKT